MRSWFFLAFFASGLAIVSWQLFGEEGSHARLAMLETALAEQNRVNESLRLRNEELAAEVFSLENREEAIEEQARRHLYMIRPQGEKPPRLMSIATPTEAIRPGFSF